MLGRFLPKHLAESVYEIDLDHLQQIGIVGIITDLDNTLVGAGVPSAPQPLMDWFKKVQDAGFRIVIVSNNNESRVARFAEPLSLPYISRAKKPLNKAYKKALRMLDLPAERSAMIGDQLLTDMFGGNRLGMYTIWVKPIELKNEGFFTKINRKIERKIARKLEQKGWITWNS